MKIHAIVTKQSQHRLRLIIRNHAVQDFNKPPTSCNVDIVSCLEMEGLLTPIGGSAGRREAFLVEEFDPRYDELWLGVVGGGLSEIGRAHV